MKAILLFSVLIFILISCSDTTSPVNPDLFINPKYQFPSERIIENKGNGYPEAWKQYPYVNGDEYIRGNLYYRMLGFCLKIQAHFSNSNMTMHEAAEFYSILDRFLQLADGNMGMPYPGEPAPVPVNNRDRVLLKKINDKTYEIFYYSDGSGGRYYEYEKVNIITNDNGATLEFKRIEAWSENVPC